MYKLGFVLGLNIIKIYYIVCVESDFKFGSSPLNNEFISKDLSDLGLNVYLEEFDFIPREVSSRGTNAEVCKNSLKRNYENDVYGLCDHFGCDISIIATRPYDKRIVPLSTLPADILIPKTENINEKQKRSCNLAKLAARCSSYLRFANCVYINYLDGLRVARSLITLDRKVSEVFQKYPNNELVDKYHAVGGGTISFIFKEFLQNICSFVHNSCPDLHPQFKGAKEYFWSQACIVFDTITVFSGYDSLITKSIDSKLHQVLVSKERNEFLSYHRIETDLVLSQLNIPLEYPYNDVKRLSLYKSDLNNHRCNIVNSLYVNTKNLDLYEDSGKYRIYSICFQLEKYYRKCDLCKNLGIQNTSKA